MSSRKIEDLIPEMQTLYRLFDAECKASGLDFIVICTTRTKEEQAELVKKGFSKTMNSKHLIGEAFDIAVLSDGKVTWINHYYEPFGKIGMDLGLEWGGSWVTWKDMPHFQYKKGVS